MKVFLLLFLIFSTFADFSSALSVDEISGSNCQNVIQCLDTDFHADSAKDHNNKEENHCHCHIGHSHAAIDRQSAGLASKNEKFVEVEFPRYEIGQLQNHHADVIRPPIA